MDEASAPSLENLLEKITEILRLIQNHQGPLVISEKLAADIQKLAALSSDFREKMNALLRAAHLTPLELEKRIENAGEMRTSDKQLLQRTKDIQIEGAVMQHVIEEELKRRRKQSRQKNSPAQAENKQRIKERKKLFKTLGGDKNWIPL